MRLVFRAPTAVRNEVKDIELDVSADMLVENVRLKVQKKLGIDEQLKLSLHGKTLDDSKPLRFYDVKENDAIAMATKYFNSYLPKGIQPEKRKREDDDEVVPVETVKQPRLMIDADLLVDEAKIKREAFTLLAGVHGEQGQRRQMEDMHLICVSLRAANSAIPQDKDFTIFGIFDGHGGKQTASFVRQALPAELATQVVKLPADQPVTDKMLRKILNESFARVDQRIATEQSGVMDGCCAIVILSLGAMCWIANLGDSAAYLARAAGPDSFKAIPLSNQHNCFAMKEKERILRMGGAVENGRINGILNVTRAFGDIHLKKFGVVSQPDLMKVTLDPEQDQFLVLGSDGLFSTSTALETVELVAEFLAAEEARAQEENTDFQVTEICRELIKDRLENKQVQDNVTAMVIVLKPV